MDTVTPDLSDLGLTIQTVGVVCLAILFRLLYRALPRPYCRIWMNA